MSELIFAPSEFAFDYSGCKRCYYDRKNDNLKISTGFPSIFSKLDRLQNPHRCYYITHSIINLYLTFSSYQVL